MRVVSASSLSSLELRLTLGIASAVTAWARLASALPLPVFVVDLRFNDKGSYNFGEIPYKSSDILFWKSKNQDLSKDQDLWKLPLSGVGVAFSQQQMKNPNLGKTCYAAVIQVTALYDCHPPLYKNTTRWCQIIRGEKMEFISFHTVSRCLISTYTLGKENPKSRSLGNFSNLKDQTIMNIVS